MSSKGGRTARERSSGLSELLLGLSREVHYVLDADGAIRYASPSVEGLLGYRPDELIGVSFATLLHAEDHD